MNGVGLFISLLELCTQQTIPTIHDVPILTKLNEQFSFICLFGVVAFYLNEIVIYLCIHNNWFIISTMLDGSLLRFFMYINMENVGISFSIRSL